MHDVVILGVKAIAGGGLVALFALVSEVGRPKLFSGLFGAAPAIALASLIVTSVSDGAGRAREAALGMIAGSAGLICYCVLAGALLSRLKGLQAALTAIAGWLAIVTPLYLGLVR